MKSDSKRLLGVIVARGGSKGLPRKNVLPAGGKPLIAWTISAALKSQSIDRLVLSSDDEEIINVARSWGCEAPFKRSAELASDTATAIDVILDVIERVPGYEFIVLLQPTSPLRSAEDIDAAFKLLQMSSAPSCISVCEADQSPYWMYNLKDDGGLEVVLTAPHKILRRQDLPPVYVLNGAIYILRVEWFLKYKNFISEESIAYLMPRDRSIDIDNIDDIKRFSSKIEELNTQNASYKAMITKQSK